MDNKVSFVLPAFKIKFLYEAVGSILSQDYHNIELIILNDASPDPIKNLIESFDDKRIKYFENQENIGGKDLVANWNKALSLATGEFVTLASDDDVYSSNYATEMVKLFEKYPQSNLAHSRVQIIDSEDRIKLLSQNISEFESCMDFVYHRLIFNRKQMAPDFMFRRSAIQEIGGFVKFPVAWYSDDATWNALAVKGVLYSQKTFLKFRMSGENISTSDKNVNQKIDALLQYKEWLRTFISNYNVYSVEDAFLQKYCLDNIDSILNSHVYFYLPYLKGTELLKRVCCLIKDKVISRKSALKFILKHHFC